LDDQGAILKRWDLGKNMREFLTNCVDFFKDDKGSLSAMRLLFISWGLGTLMVWIVLSIHSMSMVSVPWTITSFISSLVVGKVVQSYTENIGTPNGNTTANPPQEPSVPKLT
jgi:hypothetical protein